MRDENDRYDVYEVPASMWLTADRKTACMELTGEIDAPGLERLIKNLTILRTYMLPVKLRLHKPDEDSQ